MTTAFPLSQGLPSCVWTHRSIRQPRRIVVRHAQLETPTRENRRIVRADDGISNSETKLRRRADGKFASAYLKLPLEEIPMLTKQIAKGILALLLPITAWAQVNAT